MDRKSCMDVMWQDRDKSCFFFYSYSISCLPTDGRQPVLSWAFVDVNHASSVLFLAQHFISQFKSYNHQQSQFM